mgnify:CR=1 FL=1
MNNTELKPLVSKRKKVVNALVVTFCVLFMAFMGFLLVFPYWLQLASSLTSLDFIGKPGKIYWWPQGGIHFSNYAEAFRVGDLWQGFFNSIVVVVVSLVVSLVFAFVLGYCFGKLRFKGRDVWFWLILASMMVPGEVLLIPIYIIVDGLGVTETLTGVFLPGFINVFGVFMFRQFMHQIPDACLEAADIDGAGELRKIFQIAFPMCRSVILTFCIMTFTAKWNEYLWPLIVTHDPSKFVIQLKLMSFYPQFEGSGDSYLRAAALISITVPVVATYFVCQKYFLASMSISGIK